MVVGGVIDEAWLFRWVIEEGADGGDWGVSETLAMVDCDMRIKLRALVEGGGGDDVAAVAAAVVDSGASANPSSSLLSSWIFGNVSAGQMGSTRSSIGLYWRSLGKEGRDQSSGHG